MACTGRYAEAWQYAAFWCKASIRTGSDDSGGVGNLFLTDSQADFTRFGVKPNVGMMLWNLTNDTSGPITLVSQTTITATGVTWDDGDEYRVVTLTADERSTIEMYLDITSSDISAVVAVQGACDCSMATWAVALLEKLNIIDAGIFHECPCAKPQISDDLKRTYLEWINTQLENIRNGKIELCEGETGSEYPVTGWAERASTEFAAAEIIANDIERSS